MKAKSLRRVTAVNLATSVNADYLPYLIAMCSSLARSRDASTGLNLYVLHAGLSEACRGSVADVSSGVNVQWVRVDQDLDGLLPSSLDPASLTPHYYRCLAPYAIPATDRIIYLDADTVVCSDLGPLARISLRGAVALGAHDLLETCGVAVSACDAVGLDAAAPYYNTGVLVIDVREWVRRDIGREAVYRAARSGQPFLGAGRWPQYDQYELNISLNGVWGELPDGWNHYAFYPASNPKIVHFLGMAKPGFPHCRPEFAGLFDAALKGTPWAGWRPRVFGRGT